MSDPPEAPDKPAVPHVNDLPGPASIARAVASSKVSRRELVLQEQRPVRRYINAVVTRDDKEAADTISAWYGFREGRRVPHWELYNLLLAEAVENEKGRFYRMTSRSWV